jgi:hypothetical protein
MLGIYRISFLFAFVGAIALPITEIQAIGHGPKPKLSPSPPPTAAKARKTGRLIVQRSANFGSSQVLRVSIDGKKVADVPRNQHYGDLVTVGRHSVSVLAFPSIRPGRATSIRLTVKTGKVYIYTAGWNADRLVLQPSTFYIATKRANEEVRKK